MRVRNDLFDPSIGFDRGRALWVFVFWLFVRWAFFTTTLPWPSQIKVCLLRLFGAKVGDGVCIKPQVKIHFPWKLELGDHSWLGEELFILNLEPVVIGCHVCLSQRAFLCSGNHDYGIISMPYRNRPINIGDGAWIGAQVFVGPGIVIGNEAVITAGSVVTEDVQASTVNAGVPCKYVKDRWRGVY